MSSAGPVAQPVAGTVPQPQGGGVRPPQQQTGGQGGLPTTMSTLPPPTLSSNPSATTNPNLVGGGPPRTAAQNAAEAAGYSNASLYVGDLLDHVSEPHLYDVFNVVGPVASIRVCRDNVTRRSLGYAYVNYHSPAEAERALETFNFTNIEGKPCRIMWSHRDPALRKSGSGNLYVKNLDKDVDQRLLYDTFSIFGNILSCKVQQGPNGESRGFGFVHFETEESATLAIERLNGAMLKTKPITVCYFVKQSDRRGPSLDSKFTNIYVKSIPAEWNEEQTKKVFEKYGEITSLDFRHDDQNRRFAFINYDDNAHAMAAIEELNQRRTTPDGEVLEKDDPAQAEAEEKEAEQEAREAEEEAAAKEKKATSSTADEEGETPATADDNTTSADKKTQDGASTETVSSPTTKPKKTRPNRLYVSRFMSKAERLAHLTARFNSPGDTTPPNGALTPSPQSPQAARLAAGVNLFVKSLDDSIDDERLQAAFAPFGNITSAKIMRDEKGISKGFGFICFQGPEEATKAIAEMHLKMLHGKPIYVCLAERKEHRQARLIQRFSGPSYGGQGQQGMPQGGGQQGVMGGYPAQRGPQQGPGHYGGMHQGGGQGGMGQYGGGGGQAPFYYSPNMRGGAPGPSGPGGRHGPNQGSWQRGRGPPPQQQGGNPYQLPLSLGRVEGRVGQGQPTAQGGFPPYPHQQKMPGANYKVGAPNYVGGMPPTNGVAQMGGYMTQNRFNGGMSQSGMNGGGGGGQRPPNGPAGWRFTAQVRNRVDPAFQQQMYPPTAGQGMPQGGGPPPAGAEAAGGLLGPGGPDMQRSGDKGAGDGTSTDATQHLANFPASVQKQILGEKLFPRIAKAQPDLAGKITGMMLEMENGELLMLLESEDQLKAKIDEALRVLEAARVQSTAEAA